MSDLMLVARPMDRAPGYAVPRPARVEAFDTSTGEAVVTVDGDTETSDAQVVTAFPLRAGDRVFTMFVPPHGLLVVGHANGFPVIANEDDTGFASSLAVDPSWTNVKTLTLGAQPLARGYRVVARSDVGIYSLSAGAVDVEVEIGISVDGGTSYAVNTAQLSAAASGRYGSGHVTKSAAGGSAEYRPRIRVRARLLASVSGSYDLRNVYTSWTITPQGEDY
jgi:hypothetical protein